MSASSWARSPSGTIRRSPRPNPDAKLPDSDINVVVRADGSGTTFVFTQHLSAISEEFKKSPGTNKLPNWPVGHQGEENDGVAAAISKTPGSIGYLEYRLRQVQQAQDGHAGEQGGQVRRADDCFGPGGLGRRQVARDLIAWVPDPEGDGVYPIVTYTWIICYKKYDDAKKVASAEGRADLRLDRGPERERGAGLYSRCPTSANGVVQHAKAARRACCGNSLA